MKTRNEIPKVVNMGLMIMFVPANFIKAIIVGIIALFVGGCGYQVQDDALTACTKTLIVGVRPTDDIKMVVDGIAFIEVPGTDDDDDMVKRLRARTTCVPPDAFVWFEIRPFRAEYGCDPDIAILVARENGAYKRTMSWNKPRLEDDGVLVCELRFSQ